MLSRVFATRQVLRQIKDAPRLPVAQQVRNSGAVAYRGGVDPPKRLWYISEAGMGFMWWWIIWHMWTQPELVFGEWPEIDPSKWTDEDLGIPPDDVGPAPRVEKATLV